MNWKFWQKKVELAEPVKVYPIVHPQVPKVVNPLEGATVSLKDETNPKFARKYTKQLSRNAEIEITMENKFFSAGRDSRGVLTQPNGNWIVFDPERVADKILDPALVPLIEDFVRAVFEEDRIFAANYMDEFQDELGRRWQLVA